MRRHFAGLAVAAVLVLAGCSDTMPRGSATYGPSENASAGDSGPAADASGLPTCALDSLPAQATETVDDIHAGGPYVARKDGSTFGNREAELPAEPNGFYREYTVETPGSDDRGARRIVTGGSPKTDPTWYFYTDDHYESFCEVTGARP